MKQIAREILKVARVLTAEGRIEKTTGRKGSLAHMYWHMEIWHTTLKDIEKAYAKVEMQSNYEVGSILKDLREQGVKVRILKDPPRIIAQGNKVVVVVSAWFSKEDVPDWEMVLFNWEH